MNTTPRLSSLEVSLSRLSLMTSFHTIHKNHATMMKEFDDSVRVCLNGQSCSFSSYFIGLLHARSRTKYLKLDFFIRTSRFNISMTQLDVTNRFSIVAFLITTRYDDDKNTTSHIIIFFCDARKSLIGITSIIH